MNYNITICDDNKLDRRYLVEIIRRWMKNKTELFCISECESAEQFLFEDKDKISDFIFLDVQMKKMNGIELAKKIRQKNMQVQIIFVTGYIDYIQDGYEVEALNYLTKPVTEEKVVQSLERAMLRHQKSEKCIILRTKQGVICLSMNEISYISVDGNYLTVHGRENYTCKKTLVEIEKEIDQRFFRISRSEIINLKYMHKATESEIYLVDGTILPIVRGINKKLYQAVIRFL